MQNSHVLRLKQREKNTK